MTDLHVVLGSGPAGLSVAEELLHRGRRVRLVSRHADDSLSGVEAVAADLQDPAEATSAIAGAAVSYHCVNVPYERQVAVMPVVQRAILAGAEAAGSRLVVMDTLYPYGPTGGVPMTEQTPWRATSAKGRMRAELDEAYLAAHQAGRLAVTLARAADFYGPRVLNSSLGGAFFPAALHGGPAMAMGDIDLLHSYTFIPDVARGLVLLGDRPEAAGRVWHLPTAPARTTREIHRLVTDLTGTTPDLDVLEKPRPWGPFDQTFMDEYIELFYQYTEDQVMDSRDFEQTFDVQPTPLEAGLARTVEWYASLPGADGS